MKRILLTQNMHAMIDDEDFEKVNRYKWHSHKGGSTYYATTMIRLNNKRVLLRMHRLIMKLEYGDKYEIDHRDGDGLNNQKYNLRKCTNSQNKQNRNKKRTSVCKYKGITKENNPTLKIPKWKAVIYLNGRSKHLGLFNSPEEAANAYKNASLKFHKEFSFFNRKET